jgi:hypothetical protein
MKKPVSGSVRELEQTPVGRLRQFSREVDMLVCGLRSFSVLIIRGLLRVYTQFEIIGHQNLPTNGPLLIAANHCSHPDTVCLLAALRLRKLHRAFPAAASGYFSQTVPRFSAAVVLVNALPFARQARVRQSLAPCLEVLSYAGTILIIFPEGTRCTTGELGAFKSGIGLFLRGAIWQCCRVSLKGHFKRGRRTNDFRVPENFDCSLERVELIAIAEERSPTSLLLLPDYVMR